MKIFGFSILFAFGVSAQADIQKIEKTFKKCASQAMATYDYLECAYKAQEDASAELTKIQEKKYADLKASSDADDQEILKRFQDSDSAWNRSFVADCKLESTEMLKGSGEQVIYSGCLARRTIERVKFIQPLTK